jgi:hypothetical protein
VTVANFSDEPKLDGTASLGKRRKMKTASAGRLKRGGRELGHACTFMNSNTWPVTRYRASSTQDTAMATATR